jgi:hypothetical protein
LAVTCRCLAEDLGFSVDDCERPLRDLGDNAVISAFIERRSQSPEGQETVQELQPRLTAYSLHVGQHRGATWYDQKGAICWLLAVAIHREGSREDAYSYFGRLQRANKLLPTMQDVVRALERRRPSFEKILTDEIPTWRETVLANPWQVHETVLGHRIRVRAFYANGDTGLLTIAISGSLVPEGPAVPGDWYGKLLAAFLPDSEALDMAFDLGEQPLRPDENAFCGLVAQRERPRDE